MTQQDREKIKELEQTIQVTNEKINRIIFYLEDDPSTHSMGFIAKLSEVSDKLDGILRREEVYKAKATVWGMVGASIISGAIFLVKAIITTR